MASHGATTNKVRDLVLFASFGSHPYLGGGGRGIGSEVVSLDITSIATKPPVLTVWRQFAIHVLVSHFHFGEGEG